MCITLRAGSCFGFNIASATLQMPVSTARSSDASGNMLHLSHKSSA